MGMTELNREGNLKTKGKNSDYATENTTPEVNKERFEASEERRKPRCVRKKAAAGDLEP